MQTINESVLYLFTIARGGCLESAGNARKESVARFKTLNTAGEVSSPALACLLKRAYTWSRMSGTSPEGT